MGNSVRQTMTLDYLIWINSKEHVKNGNNYMKLALIIFPKEYLYYQRGWYLFPSKITVSSCFSIWYYCTLYCLDKQLIFRWCRIRGKKCSFFEKFGVLCFLETGFEIRLFALLPMNKFLMIYSRVPNSKSELFKNELFLFLFVQCGWYLFFSKYWVSRKIKSMLLIPYGKCLPLIPYPLESIAFSNYFFYVYRTFWKSST